MEKKVFVKPSAQTVQCEAATILAASGNTSGNISEGGANGRNSRDMNDAPEVNDNLLLDY